METQIFHHAKNIPNLLKNPLTKETKNSSRYYYYNSIITNLKFQHKPKSSSFKKKSSYKNRLIIIIIIIFIIITQQGPKIPKLLYAMMNLNTISLPWYTRPIKFRRVLMILNSTRDTTHDAFELCLLQELELDQILFLEFFLTQQAINKYIF